MLVFFFEDEDNGTCASGGGCSFIGKDATVASRESRAAVFHVSARKVKVK